MRSESAGRTHKSAREVERAGVALPRRCVGGAHSRGCSSWRSLTVLRAPLVCSLGVRGAGVNKERADRCAASRRLGCASSTGGSHSLRCVAETARAATSTQRVGLTTFSSTVRAVSRVLAVAALTRSAGDERPADSAPATVGDLRAQLSARPAAAARGRAPGSSLHRPRAPSERRVGAASQLSLAQLLCSLNLERFLPLFEAEEMDMAALALCSEEDLRALGVPMGPRKKILALLSAQV